MESERGSEKAVVVTTAHRGVFFGYIPSDGPTDQRTIKLERARLCVYWSHDVRGFMGLAASGPTESCKIGPAAKSITLQDVTAVLEMTDKAVLAWERAPWN